MEFYKEQQEASKVPLSKHLKLLMKRSITYSWSSMRDFHLFVNNAVKHSCLSWNSSEIIHMVLTYDVRDEDEELKEVDITFGRS